MAGCEKEEEEPAATEAITSSTAVTVTALPTKTLAEGETWEVSETTSLSSLTVGDGAIIAAPAGKSRDPDGGREGDRAGTGDDRRIRSGVRPGDLHGDVVLTVADANPVEYTAPGGRRPCGRSVPAGDLC